MKITITVDDLIDADACSEAVDFFWRLYGDDYTFEWTPEKQREILLDPEQGRFLFWLFYEQFLPIWSCKKMDFRGADFGATAYDDWNIEHLSFWHADLRNANFKGAFVQRVDFDSADLRGADFRNVDLSTCNFIGAKMSGVLYNENTKFPPGFNPTLHDMVREGEDEEGEDE